MEETQAKPVEIQTLSPYAIRRLLEALGEWGVAEQKGLPTHMVNIFAERAQDAFEDISQAS